MGHRSTSTRRIGVAALLLMGSTFASVAWAADDGYENVFSSVLTAVGVLPQAETPEIDYRERAPLVLPPKQELAKPQVAGVRPAAWPQDPDVAAREAEKSRLNAPMISLFDKRRDRPDSKAEMVRQRAVSTTDDTSRPCIHDCRVTPDEMRKQDERYRASNPAVKDVVTAGSEPDRLYLTQPPKGYMKATRTVRATAEAPDIRRDTSNPLSALIERPRDDASSPNE